MEKDDWIKNKDRCWICRRTKEEVFKDSDPMGDLFDIGKDCGEKEMIENAFMVEGIDLYGHVFPICRVCNGLLAVVSWEDTKKELDYILKDLFG